MKRVRALAAVVAVAALAGCGRTAPAAAMPPPLPEPILCSETTATPAAERPEVLAGTTGSWFGAQDLWVGLPERAATAQGDRLVLKFPWVTLQGQEPTDERGSPRVSATRDGSPTPVPATFDEYARSFGTGNLAFWPATIEFPAPGCWTVTGTMAATTVRIVVRVAAE